LTGASSDSCGETWTQQRTLNGMNSKDWYLVSIEAPFEAQFVVKRHVEKLSKELPLTAESVLHSTYMDDTMDSVADDETAKELYCQLSKMWKSCGMHARKWLSNSKKLLSLVPREDCAKMINIQEEQLPSKKALGILWIAEKDVFSYKSMTITE
jgi:hypothetical protein